MTDVAALEVFMGVWKDVYLQRLACSEHSINTCGMNEASFRWGRA